MVDLSGMHIRLVSHRKFLLQLTFVTERGWRGHN